jgi:aldose 1-epimerase
MSGSVESRDWGTLEGERIELFTMQNASGLVMKVTNYGATITELHVPDRSGDMADVVLGFDDLQGYLSDSPYFGCIAGRCANRIAAGSFELDDSIYQLASNDGVNHLHGGTRGFDKRVWDATVLEMVDGPAVRFERLSPDGEEGYPGNLRVAVTYTLTNNNELRTEIEATTDAATVCNIAQHTYWNLAGHDSGPVLDHVLEFRAERYTPVNDSLIPTGSLSPVAGTPFDFREAKPIGRDLAAVGGDPVGYDHNLVVDGRGLRLVCRVTEPRSGRTMELYSDQPGCQFYSGNFLDGSISGKGGAVYAQYQGFCLETQLFPDAIHQPAWPSPVLRPGETYRHVMITRFGTAPGSGSPRP